MADGKRKSGSQKKRDSPMADGKQKSGSQKKREKRSLSDLKTLGHQLLSSRTHINNLPLLLNYITPSSPPNYVCEALLSLQSFFSTHLATASSHAAHVDPDAASDPEFIYRTWVRSKFDELLKSAIDIAVSPQCEETLREVVLDTLMEFVKLGNGGKFYNALYHKLIHAIVNSSLEVEFILESLSSTYFKYIDVRYYTFITIDKLCKGLEPNNSSGDKTVISECDDQRESFHRSINKIYFLLSHLGTLDKSATLETWSTGFLSKEDDQDHSKDSEGSSKQENREISIKSGFSINNVSKKMKRRFSEAWMSFLRLPLPLDVYKEVLVNIRLKVIPYMSNPVMLCDFLTRSYDIGGVVSVMALNGLFDLMTKYGLEYSNFYEKLYALLTPSIFMAKHRSKFFQLLDSCLKSQLLSAKLAAAFTKKLSRLSLKVPPSGALVIIALVHNVLRRHPAINFLVHRDNSEETNQDNAKPEEKHISSEGDAGVVSDMNRERQGVDLFNEEESNTEKSNAMSSSLWEIDTLRHHYCPPVSRFVLSLENDLTVRAKTTEVTISDFSSGSYSTILGDELNRRVKHVPVAVHVVPGKGFVWSRQTNEGALPLPTSLFSDSDFPGWTFKSDQPNNALTVE